MLVDDRRGQRLVHRHGGIAEADDPRAVAERLRERGTQDQRHILESFARAGGVTLNVKGRGRNDHHLAEAAFKALGRSLRAATLIDPRRTGAASTKGTLG